MQGKGCSRSLYRNRNREQIPLSSQSTGTHTVFGWIGRGIIQLDLERTQGMSQVVGSRDQHTQTIPTLVRLIVWNSKKALIRPGGQRSCGRVSRRELVERYFQNRNVVRIGGYGGA